MPKDTFNNKLRQEICKNMLKSLIDSGYFQDKMEAKYLILHIEKQILEQYHTMESTYTKLMQNIIKILQLKLVEK